MIPSESTVVVTDTKRGITLLEVIISLGILSVGLASVVALIPAGGSQAKKAVIEDRRGAMAAAAMADLITRGLLDQNRWTTTPAPPLLLDPLGGGFSVPGLSPITIRGITSLPVADEVFRSPDDLVYTLPDDEDLPATPRFFSGPSKRMTEGLFSWLATLVPVTPGSPFYRLSVIEFYRRPTQQTLPSMFTLTAPKTTSDSYVEFSVTPPMATDDFRSLFPVGSVVLCRDAATAVCEWRRVIMAAPVVSGSSVTAGELTVDRAVPVNTASIHAIEGAVGLAERTVRLEEMSPWSQ